MPTFAPSGSAPKLSYRWLTRASPASALSVTAVITSPSGTITGISFRLCTAISISPASMAVSNSLVKSPLPPIFARGALRILSPLVVMSRFSIARSGYLFRNSPMTKSACHRASWLLLVPTISFFLLIGINLVSHLAYILQLKKILHGAFQLLLMSRAHRIMDAAHRLP